MLENIRNASVFSQGLFVTVVGLIETFLILLLFFAVIKIMGKWLLKKKNKMHRY